MQKSGVGTGTGPAEKTQSRLTIPQAALASADVMQNLLRNPPRDAAQIANHLAASTGKGLRGRLLLVCAQNRKGLVPETAAVAAAAVELLHLATLVHDDVIDDSPTRRGMPTAHSLFGKKQSVIAGDYVFCLALQCVSDAGGQFKRYVRAMSKVCLGELLQGEQNGNLNLRVSQYLRIIEKKTAALFYLSAFEGAALSRCREPQARLLVRIGVWIGMLFQIADDLKDYLFDQTAAQKPVYQDLRCGVVTLPLIFALSREPALASLAGEVMRTGEGVESLIAQVERHGGVKEAWRIASRYREKALAAAEKLENPCQRRELLEMVHKTLESLAPRLDNPCKAE